MAADLARVKRAAKRRADADEAWRAAIRAASDDGASLRQIAVAAGVSNVRIHQILNGR